MPQNELFLVGLTCKYPEYVYTTKEFIELLDNKLSEQVKENIIQLGVEQRHFIKPIETYLDKTQQKNNPQNFHEPISDLCTQVAIKCLENLGIKLNEITGLIAAYEDNDFLSPGLGSILLTKIGLSQFLPHYNIQGMACSTLPKLLELGKSLVLKEEDKILVVISGCNSKWYLSHLLDDKYILSPKEFSSDQPDYNNQIKKWVATMFSFLFGDGVTAFVLTKSNLEQYSIKIGKITHAVNFDELDYRKASVRMLTNSPNSFYEYDLTANSDILQRSLNYSKKVLMKSLGENIENYNEELATNFMSKQKKVMIHTGSLKILNGFKNLYNLKNEQIMESFDTLKNYGNLTGVSIPTVLDKSLKNDFQYGNGLLIGITMGFGLDIVEVEKTD